METINSLRRKIKTTQSLGGIVSSMKTLSSVSIHQYERANQALRSFEDVFKSALRIILWNNKIPEIKPDPSKAIYILIGSDQGLVGHFNQSVWTAFSDHLEQQPFRRPRCILLGRHLILKKPQKLSVDALGSFALSNSVKGITKLVQGISNIIEPLIDQTTPLHIVYNRRTSGGGVFETGIDHPLPLTDYFFEKIVKMPWPTNQVPIVFGDQQAMFLRVIFALTLSHLYRVISESQAAEHFARVVAMQGAEKNIEEHLVDMNLSYQNLRQQGITEELLDIVNGSGL